MTDLARYVPPPPPSSSLDLAPQAWKLAEKIANTEMVPTALRGRPEAVLAVMLAGHEAGVAPMQSLQKIHIIEGRPAMAAELMRALVMQHGHELVYDETTTTSVTASGRRRGAERWTKVMWTMDDAKRGGLDGKPNWRKWPRAMLIARATAELCRMIFPDVLAGISYTVEELSDGDQLPAGAVVDFGPAEVVPPPATATTTATTARAGRAITRQAPVDDVETKIPPPAGEVPPLPGDEIHDAEVVETAPPEVATSAPIDTTATEVATAPSAEEDWPSGEWPSEPSYEDQRRYTGPQLIAIRLGNRFGIKGNTDEARTERLRAIAHILERPPIESSKDLTPADISRVIELIDAWPEDRPLYPEGHEQTAAQTPTEPSAPSQVPPEPPNAAVVDAQPPETGESEPPPRRPTRSSAPPAPSTPSNPDTWTGEQWREFLGARKVKVTETIREAQRLGALRDPAVSCAMLDDIAASGLATELLGWVEDLSLDRRGK